MSPEDFRSKYNFFLHLFKEKKLEGKFILSPTIEVVGYSSLKKYTRKKSAEEIEDWERNSKRKSVEAK
jgi:hypothetical protein